MKIITCKLDKGVWDVKLTLTNDDIVITLPEMKRLITTLRFRHKVMIRDYNLARIKRENEQEGREREEQEKLTVNPKGPQVLSSKGAVNG